MVLDVEGEREAGSNARPWLLTSALVGVLCCALWAATKLGWPAPPSAAAFTAAEQPADGAGPADEDEDSESEEASAIRERLADADRMLNQAEAERRELEQNAAQGKLDRQSAADNARKREEAERDRKRHETVQRDLESMGLAAARRKVSITMYSTSWCGVCKKASAYMHEQNIPFTELDVEHDDAARVRAHELNPRNSVPVITVDDDVLIGFSPGSLESRIVRAARRRNGS